MALVDVDSWLTEYESCLRLNDTLTSQLRQRDGKIHSSPDYTRLTQSIQVGIKQFDRELQQLKFKLDEASRAKTIAFEDVERRQSQLDALQTQRRQLQAKYTNSEAGERALLFGNSATSSSVNVAGEDSDVAPIIDTTDIQRLKQHQIDMLEQQNRGLETLSQTISRQIAISTRMGQEVEEQNDILDNLVNTIERVETGVSRETHSISLVNRRDSTWGYWIVITILFIAIVVVAVL